MLKSPFCSPLLGVLIWLPEILEDLEDAVQLVVLGLVEDEEDETDAGHHQQQQLRVFPHLELGRYQGIFRRRTAMLFGQMSFW